MSAPRRAAAAANLRARRFTDRGMRVVAGYLDEGCDAMDGLLADARELGRRGLPGGARSTLVQLGRRLDRHIRLDERVVIPMLEAQRGPHPAAADWRREHVQLRALVDAALASVGRRSFGDTTRRLGERLERHHRRERRILDVLEA